MQVRMRVTISGTRDGQSWPERGGVVELPEEEATHLVAVGLAEDAKDAEDSEGGGEPAEETATAKGTPETATPKRGRSTK